MSTGFFDVLCLGGIEFSKQDVTEFRRERDVMCSRLRGAKVKEWTAIRQQLTRFVEFTNKVFDVAMNELGYYSLRAGWHERKIKAKLIMPHRNELRSVITPDEAPLLILPSDGVAELVARCGGMLAKQLQDLLIARLTKDKKKVKAIKAELDTMKRRLEGPNPKVIEELIVERIVSAWLTVVWAEYLFEVCATDLEDLRLGVYADRIKKSANFHYMNALTRLDLVRRTNPIRGMD